MNNQIEKLNFVRDGATRLPPGFRFQPTDEELVFQYLKCKILRLPLPASIIPELINVSNFDPWDLPGDMEQDRYFFTKKEAKYRIGNRTNRTTPSGYWKATSSDKPIASIKRNVNMAMRGLRKTLVFYRGKPPHGTRTDWFMHEYSLTIHNAFRTSSSHAMQCSSMEWEDWLICRVYTKDATNNNNVSFPMDMCNVNYALTASCSSSSSSSSSSGTTEVNSSNRMEYKHEEAGLNYSYYFQPY
ncbi:hypothetical protein V2J09_011917 [Rumex salicifolius]